MSAELILARCRLIAVSCQLTLVSFVVEMVRSQRGSNPSSSSSHGSSSTRRAERALVKWAEGAHANQITPDVDLDWIIGIDAASPEFPETYAIEWRVPPRPRNGWPVYDGLVMDISCKFLPHSICIFLHVSWL